MLRTQIFHGLRAVILGTALISALRLIQFLILARLLPPEVFGIIGIAIVGMTLLAVFAEIGAGSVVIYRQSLTAVELNTLFWIGTSIGIGLFAFLQLASPLLAMLLGEPKLEGVFRVLSVTCVTNPLGLPYRSLLEKGLVFGRIAIIESMGVFVGTLTSILLASQGVGLHSISYGLVTVSAATSLLFITAGWSQWKPNFKLSIGTVGSNFHFGANLTGQRLSNFAMGNTDFFLIGTFIGSHALGYYTAAFNLANIPSSRVISLLSRVCFPAMSQIQNDIERLRRAFLRYQEVSGLIVAPMMMGFAILAPSGVPILLGPGWEPSVLLFQLLCIVGLTRAVGGAVGPLLLARGRPDLGFRWSAILGALHIASLFIGLQVGGAVGVAMAYIAVQIVSLALGYVALVRTQIGPCLRDYLRVTLTPIAYSLLMLLAMHTVKIILPSSVPINAVLTLEAMCGILTYSLLILMFHPVLVSDLKHIVKATLKA